MLHVNDNIRQRLKDITNYPIEFYFNQKMFTPSEMLAEIDNDSDISREFIKFYNKEIKSGNPIFGSEGLEKLRVLKLHELTISFEDSNFQKTATDAVNLDKKIMSIFDEIYYTPKKSEYLFTDVFCAVDVGFCFLNDIHKPLYFFLKKRIEDGNMQSVL